MRAHYFATIPDREGNLLNNSTVRVLQPGTEVLLDAPLFIDNDSATQLSNPFIATDGEMSFYLDLPTRVRIGITSPGQNEIFYEDVDVGGIVAAGQIDQSHTGQGVDSTSVGTNSNSSGQGALAIGNTAVAAGQDGVAAGHNSVAQGNASVAVGAAATVAGLNAIGLGAAAVASATGASALGQNTAAQGVNSTALGLNAVATQAQASALGQGASAGHAHATALGAETATTEPNQVRLGGSGDVADAPGGLVLRSPNGTKFRLIVDDAGTLGTRLHVPSGTLNLLSGDEVDFEESAGGFTAAPGSVASLTVANSTDQANVGTHSLKVTTGGTAATGGAPAAAESAHKTASVGYIYTGRAKAFMPFADSSTTSQAVLAFYDSSSSLIGSVSAGVAQKFQLADGTSTMWVIIDVRATAPAGTATVALRLRSTNLASSKSIYFDTAELLEQQTLTS